MTAFAPKIEVARPQDRSQLIDALLNIPGGVTMTPGATCVGDEVLVTYATQTRKLSEHQLFSVRLKIFPIDWFYRE